MGAGTFNAICAGKHGIVSLTGLLHYKLQALLPEGAVL
jgi:hypothetical protein